MYHKNPRIKACHSKPLLFPCIITFTL